MKMKNIFQLMISDKLRFVEVEEKKGLFFSAKIFHIGLIKKIEDQK